MRARVCGQAFGSTVLAIIGTVEKPTADDIAGVRYLYKKP